MTDALECCRPSGARKLHSGQLAAGPNDGKRRSTGDVQGRRGGGTTRPALVLGEDTDAERITMALVLRELYGRKLTGAGGEEPMADEWETGARYRT